MRHDEGALREVAVKVQASTTLPCATLTEHIVSPRRDGFSQHMGRCGDVGYMTNVTDVP